MVAVDHEKCVRIKATAVQGVEECSDRSVAVVKSVEVLPGVVRLGKRTALGSRIGVMAGDGKVVKEEALPTRQGINPRQYPLNGRGFVHTETGIEIPAHGSCVFQQFETALLDDCVHAQKHASAGVKQ